MKKFISDTYTVKYKNVFFEGGKKSKIISQ